MSDPFIGMIVPFAFQRVPQNWAMCLGQTLPVAQNQALYSLIANLYGTATSTSFFLPDLRGRMVIGFGQRPGSTFIYQMGNSAGAETATLTLAQLPTHNHPATFTPGSGGSPIGVNVSVQTNPTSAQPTPDATHNNLGPVVATGPEAVNMWSNAGSGTINLGGVSVTGGSGGGTVTIGTAGSSAPVTIRNPLLAINFCIALLGEYPIPA
ncbi:MAG: tail fiber protein [Magnetococcales bacterium]|nr:tail fiber protein [Magnetococcales bacterium]